MSRLIPFLLLPVFIGSGVALWWYGDLTPDERAQADAIAADYAAKLYHKAVGELSRAEADHVRDLTRRRLAD